jgi:cytochrome c556
MLCKRFKTLALVLFSALALTACGGVDPNSPLGLRQALFKQMLQTSEGLSGMLRGRSAFDQAEFVAGSAKLDELAQQPWQHFPQVKEEDNTRAKDEIWQRQERFQELARALEGSTAALRIASLVSPLDSAALVAPMQHVEDSCKACHKEFRAF